MRLFICALSIMLTAAPLQAQANTPTAEPRAGAEAGDALPDAMQHAVKAPPFDINTLRDPFSSYLERAAAQGKADLAKRQRQLNNRKRETLENFDLASLKLVAIFRMGDERVAMIEDGTTKGHIVRIGNHLGKHNGKITKITDESILLVEQVFNPAGEIVSRPVTLTLNEVNE